MSHDCSLQIGPAFCQFLNYRTSPDKYVTRSVTIVWSSSFFYFIFTTFYQKVKSYRPERSTLLLGPAHVLVMGGALRLKIPTQILEKISFLRNFHDTKLAKLFFRFCLIQILEKISFLPKTRSIDQKKYNFV